YHDDRRVHREGLRTEVGPGRTPTLSAKERTGGKILFGLGHAARRKRESRRWRRRPNLPPPPSRPPNEDDGTEDGEREGGGGPRTREKGRIADGHGPLPRNDQRAVGYRYVHGVRTWGRAGEGEHVRIPTHDRAVEAPCVGESIPVRIRPGHRESLHRAHIDRHGPESGGGRPLRGPVANIDRRRGPVR